MARRSAAIHRKQFFDRLPTGSRANGKSLGSACFPAMLWKRGPTTDWHRRACVGTVASTVRRRSQLWPLNSASEVVCPGLRQLADAEGEVFPPGSLKHLYTREENA